MPKYIEVVTAAEVISQKHNIPLTDLVDTFAEIPAADVAPVVHGQWVLPLLTVMCYIIVQIAIALAIEKRIFIVLGAERRWTVRRMDKLKIPCKYAKFTNGGGNSCTYYWICNKYKKYTDPQHCERCKNKED